MDFKKAVQIAPKIYWIGKYLENDPFQCHPYLIVNGNESILIDPGSMMEFDAVLEKTKELIPLKNVKYIIVHHQDPDLVASVPALEKLINREDLQIVTHSRMTVLIKHYMIKSDYYEIDKNDFVLNTNNGISLKFITTPYCHSPGAYVSYEPNTKVLFSSDIFGGLEESWQFYADENYFEKAKLFHEEYMPSRNIFNYTLNKIKKLDIEMIAPQHGSIIKREYIDKLIEDMKKLDCGIYIDRKYQKDLLDVIEKLEVEIEKNTQKDKLLYEQAKNAQMGEMLSMIAHQWRQPLNAMSASAIHLSLQQNFGMLDEKAILEHSAFLQEATQKMSKTIDTFMNFFKPKNEKQILTFEEIIDEVLSLIAGQLKNKNVKFLFLSDYSHINVYQSELSHILINLIKNSIDAFEDKNIEDKMIEVKSYIENDFIIIRVLDNAGGIPNSIIEKIFNPYFTTKEQGKGTGIGLHMTQRIVKEIFQGSIEVENYNDGSAFTIKFPK
ncbi:MAG: ATP-binding protein [Campylobacterota bacterium]|nr:ATP-binding protein [Campylobacterota bacterium]